VPPSQKKKQKISPHFNGNKSDLIRRKTAQQKGQKRGKNWEKAEGNQKNEINLICRHRRRGGPWWTMVVGGLDGATPIACD